MPESMDPYVRLWAAVMAQAVSDVRTAVKRGRLRTIPDPSQVDDSEMRGAICWIISDDKRPGGFLWCCDLFDMNPDYVRYEATRARPTGVMKYALRHFGAEDDDDEV